MCYRPVRITSPAIRRWAPTARPQGQDGGRGAKPDAVRATSSGLAEHVPRRLLRGHPRLRRPARAVHVIATTSAEVHPPTLRVLAEQHVVALTLHADDHGADAAPGVEPGVHWGQLGRSAAHEHGGERRTQPEAARC